MKRRTSAILVSLVLSVGVGFVGSLIYFYSGHALVQNDRWFSTKTFMHVGLMGAHAFKDKRQALAFDRLNLNAWHGEQEVSYQYSSPLSRFEGDSTIFAGGVLNVIFNRSTHGAQGIRFSRNKQLPGMIFTMNVNGQFTSRQVLPTLQLNGEPLHFALERNGTDLALTLNGTMVAQVPGLWPSENVISFRSQGAGAALNAFKINTLNGEIRENFSPVWDAQTFIKITFALSLLSLGGAVLLYSWDFYSGKTGKLFFSWCLIQIVACAFGMTFWAVDYYFWTPQYFYRNFSPRASSAALADTEQFREQIFAYIHTLLADRRLKTKLPPFPFGILDVPYWPPDNRSWMNGVCQIHLVSGEVLSTQDPLQYVANLAPDELWQSTRVLWLGSSQTLGMGASNIRSSFVSRFLTQLNQMDDHKRFFGINFAASADTSAGQLAQYRKFGHVWKPHYVLVNLSHNDGRSQEFPANLREIVRITRALNAQPIFVLEPNNIANGPGSFNHAFMRQVAKEFAVPVYDLNEYLRRQEIYDSGFVWWDVIHFTNYGHKLAADWLVDRFRETVRL